MTIGKRKGYTAKGAGAQPNADNTKKVGGSLSKNDHWYLQQAFGTSLTLVQHHCQESKQRVEI